MKILKVEDITPNHARELYVRLHYPEFYEYLLSHYPSELSFGEKLCWYHHNLTEYPVCKVCGKRVGFVNSLYGYKDYCSKKCCNSSAEKIEAIKQTNIAKFGGVAPACSKDVQDKMKTTNLQRYGDANYNNRESAKKTMIDKYGGVGNAAEQTKAKQKATLLERYGVDNCMHVDSIKDKIRQNNIEKYGVEWGFNRKDVQQKIVETNMERHGVPHYTNPEKAYDTIKRNNIEKYGKPYTFQMDYVKQKSIQTCIERYGSPTFNNYEKNVKTCQENYGVENHMQIPGVVDKIIETKKKNHTFNTSNIEEQFAAYLTEQQIPFERQYKSEKYPFRCDFYIPKFDLYVEIQGNWTHGLKPFENTKEDQQKLRSWKSKNTEYYNAAITTWTVGDVKKREIAKQNNLNYLEIFSTNINEVIYEYERAVEGL